MKQIKHVCNFLCFVCYLFPGICAGPAEVEVLFWENLSTWFWTM